MGAVEEAPVRDTLAWMGRDEGLAWGCILEVKVGGPAGGLRWGVSGRGRHSCPNIPLCQPFWPPPKPWGLPASLLQPLPGSTLPNPYSPDSLEPLPLAPPPSPPHPLFGPSPRRMEGVAPGPAPMCWGVNPLSLWITQETITHADENLSFLSLTANSSRSLYYVSPQLR